ncbi:MAG: hypothetical protein CEE38_12135 [Planctomycetes bacterium B3_Pla]|nr:MAG: hypothetical protein CEE38_12135 [Planctomycetes bacterium B3_Pla]
MNFSLLENNPSIIAVVLFGSQARNDSDDYSDKDIFVLCSCADIVELVKIKKHYGKVYAGSSIGLCCYRRVDAEAMANTGSLFMWHLKLQGRIVFSKHHIFEDILDRLKPYSKYNTDLLYYRELLTDVVDSYDKRFTLSEFDMSVLFTIARNICILLCHSLGNPKFGRSNAYLYVQSVYKDVFPLDDWIYPFLCSQKLLYERAIDTNRDEVDNCSHRVIIGQIQSLLEFAETKCI